MASSAMELFQNAETAVYMVKRSGKNAVLVYSSEILRQENPQYRYSGGYHENASTIYALTAAIDAKDHYTFRHSQNVAYYAEELGKAVGLAKDLTEIIREAALLHDIGKIGIREDILNKPGKLTPEEFENMKSHVENAVNIIRHLPSLDYVIPTVLSHHERYDGLGYPRRLQGEDIPIMGRILCIADSFDAMTSQRPYRMPLPMEEAVAILRTEAGKQFDPKLVLTFIEQLEAGEIRVLGTDSTEEAAPLP
jgi:putative nucleotidyltransferase with HDIG domain